MKRGFGGLDAERRAGWASSMMEDHSGAADSTAGAVEIWVGSTSKMRSWAGSAAWVGLFAQGAFGEARAGLAGGDELAGELDEVGGNVDGRSGRLEDGRLAEGDLFVEGEVFGFVERVEACGGVSGGEGLGDDGVG